ncbi:dephospho-CoA kinase [Litoreibacter ascidiaceicola]|uniref:Dephospho-CoA kinase n=1 Tax=Litoreibacter ascidiaceicola TaxID=1486859 RepID=A0A1M5BTR5_9RHOB|nr:dephospho-CoA kinase [Litoreibacter ascidiaceicola]SHF45731.1 dephospho-CoA kinase [Litoreibacter ascidiaceicola]
MTTKRFILGLTGSIGMGKSTTAQMFRDLGVPVWDADQAVAELYSKGGGAVEALHALNSNFVVDGAADRQEMKQAIAADASVLTKIENVIHPLVRAHREKFLSSHAKDKLVVLDIPLLFETGAQDQVDAILVVSAPAHVQRERVLERGTMSPEMFEAILAKQLPDAQKRARADHIIETLTLEGTKADVTSLVENLRARHA